MTNIITTYDTSLHFKLLDVDIIYNFYWYAYRIPSFAPAVPGQVFVEPKHRSTFFIKPLWGTRKRMAEGWVRGDKAVFQADAVFALNTALDVFNIAEIWSGI
jgi:hypothetical protein